LLYPASQPNSKIRPNLGKVDVNNAPQVFDHADVVMDFVESPTAVRSSGSPSDQNETLSTDLTLTSTNYPPTKETFAAVDNETPAADEISVQGTDDEIVGQPLMLLDVRSLSDQPQEKTNDHFEVPGSGDQADAEINVSILPTRLKSIRRFLFYLLDFQLFRAVI